MKKQFLRVKQIADQTFLRAEKTEVLTEDLINAEKRVDIIKQSFQAAHKKISSCQIDFGSEGSAEKRMKKLPQVALAASMLENGYSFSKNSVLGATLKECASTQAKLGNELLEYYNEVEKSILKPISNVLENEVHTIGKLRKQLGKLTLDMDSARNRFLSAEKQQASSSTTSVSSSAAKVEKLDTLKDELEEASLKVEQCRDALACEMFSLISKEPCLSEIFVHLHKLQATYHRNALAALEASLPILEKELGDFPQKPVYGCSLLEHLRVTDREIALVIETCVYFLLEYGLLEEGLLRITGSASKLKKLKSAFDAGIDIDMTEYIRDPHAVSGALKSYLRELPEPLLTFSLYEEWVNAVRITDFDQRLQALWQVLYKLPSSNLVNLRYIVKFLSKLGENSDVNKMSSQNIAIVMAPNLIWAAFEDSNFGINMQIANLHSNIVDMLITYADWFFPDTDLPVVNKFGSSQPFHSEEEQEENVSPMGFDSFVSNLKASSKSVKKLAAPPLPPKKVFHEKLENNIDSGISSDRLIQNDNDFTSSNRNSNSLATKQNIIFESDSTASAEDIISSEAVVCRRSDENIASLSIAKTEKPSVPEKPLSYSSFSLDRKIQRTSFASKNSTQDKMLEYVPRTQRPTVPPPERPAKPSRFSVIENSTIGEVQKPIAKFDASSNHPESETQLHGSDSQRIKNSIELNESEISDMVSLKQHFDEDFCEQSGFKSSVKQNRFDFLVAQTAEKPPERPPRSFPIVQDNEEGTNVLADGTSHISVKELVSSCSPKRELPSQLDVMYPCVAAISKSPDAERPKPPRPQPPIPFAKPKTSSSDNTNL